MEEYGESKDKDYPRGRGYGNDYMRGGEVFGGYGYKERADYDRPRGDGNRGRESEVESDEEDDSDRPLARRPDGEGEDDRDGTEPPERFPQDERAGGWDIPHDVVEEPGAAPERAAAPPAKPPRDNTEPGSERPASEAGADAPEPIIEHTFGDTGGARSHSRSYYVTQAQLQQRLLQKER
ncbi:MAG TPA: hypothetical protein VIQ60_08340 [Gemmatimonadaceae bacterium]